MERPDIEGKIPVDERESMQAWIQSRTGHVESAGKKGGPPSKPKYYPMTDSGAVL